MITVCPIGRVHCIQWIIYKDGQDFLDLQHQAIAGDKALEISYNNFVEIKLENDFNYDIVN